MIAVKLMGGLGNQLFQYAAGRALSIKHNTQLFLDTSFLEADPKNSYTKRNYELDCFSIQSEKCPENILNSIASQNESSIWNRVRKKIGLADKIKLYTEQGHQFNEQFKVLSDNTHLTGFWQSELYFADIEEILREDLNIKQEYLNGIETYLSLINNGISVSLHVRRGDYVNLKSASDFHGVCGLDHYAAALRLMNEKHKNLNVFVFSDDIAWCKENLMIPNDNKHYVSTDSAVKDLYLMQKCNHHIIANSSFSWWGAWLNPRKEKTIIAPGKWFNDSAINTKDIIPHSWIQI